MIPIFRGHVTLDGQLVLDEAQKAQRRTWLDTLIDTDVEVTIRKVREQRSLDQNAYLHAVPAPLLGEYWGEDIETTKLLMLGECFGWRVTREGVRVPIKPSTSKLSVEEFSHLIEWLPPWAMTNFGVSIPLPSEAEAA